MLSLANAPVQRRREAPSAGAMRGDSIGINASASVIAPAAKATRRSCDRVIRTIPSLFQSRPHVDGQRRAGKAAIDRLRTSRSCSRGRRRGGAAFERYECRIGPQENRYNRAQFSAVTLRTNDSSRPANASSMARAECGKVLSG